MSFTRAVPKNIFSGREKKIKQCRAWPLPSPREGFIPFHLSGGEVRKTNQSLKNGFWGSRGLCRKKQIRSRFFFATAMQAKLPAPCSQLRERVRRQNSPSTMGRVSVFKPEGRELESRSGRAKFSSSHWGKTMFQVPYSSHILILSGVEAVQACAKKTRKNNFSEPNKLFFCKARFHPIKP